MPTWVLDDSIASELASNTFGSDWGYLTGNGFVSGFASVSGNKLRLTGATNGYLYRRLVRKARTYGNVRVVVSLSPGEINANGDLFVSFCINGADAAVLQVTTTGTMQWFFQDASLPVSPSNGGQTGTITGTDSYKIEVVKTGNYPFGITANLYNVTSGDIGSGATLVSTKSFGGVLGKYQNRGTFQGFNYVGLNAPNSGTKVISGFEIYDDTDAQVPWPQITQNDSSQVTFQPLWGRSGLRGTTTVQYRLHRQIGATSFTPSGSTALGPYQPSTVLTDATGATNTSYSYIIEMNDGSVSVYSPFIAVTTKRTGLCLLWWGHSYVQGGTSYGQTSVGVGLVQKTTDILSSGRLSGTARTINSLNQGVGGSSGNEWAVGHEYLASAIQAGLAYGCNASIGMLYTNDGAVASTTVASYMKSLTDRLRAVPQIAWTVVLAAPGTLNGNFLRAIAQTHHNATKTAVHDGKRVFVLGESIIDLVAKNTGTSTQTNPVPLYTAGATNPSTTSWLFTDGLHYNDFGIDMQAPIAAEAIIEAEKGVAVFSAFSYAPTYSVMAGVDRGDGTPGTYVTPDASYYHASGPSFGPNGTTSGTATTPSPAQVLAGNSWQTGSTTYTGTAAQAVGSGSTKRKHAMIYNQPSSALASVAIDGTTPAKLFATREGEGGWGCANNTGQAVYFLECRPGEAVTAATVRAAGRKVADGDVAEGGSRRGDVYALLASAGSATLYPQQYSQAV